MNATTNIITRARSAAAQVFLTGISLLISVVTVALLLPAGSARAHGEDPVPPLDSADVAGTALEAGNGGSAPVVLIAGGVVILVAAVVTVVIVRAKKK